MIERYETPEINAIWKDQNRFQKWLDVELAVCKAWNEAGKIPDEDYRNIVDKASFSVQRIREIEEVTQHDVIAFVSSVAECIGESGRYVHLGLTSSDVIDTASSLLLKESMDAVLDALKVLHKTIGEKALEYKMTPCAGRTHGIHAEPTTFGLKMLNHYAEIGRDIERIIQTKKEIMVGGLSGAVGTYANCPPSIEARTCELLGLGVDPVSTQVIQRDRHARVVTDLAICGASLERLALEVRHLQRTEVLEASEPFKKGQKGSSAMPHKKNPILSERVCGMARLLRGYTVPAVENIALWHERDISHSSVERVMWPDVFHLILYMTKTMTKIISGIYVNKEKMKENIEITNGLLFSGRILITLVEREGISREEAYTIAQSNAMRCWNEKTPLLELLKNDPRIKKTSESELESLFDLEYYLKHIEEVFSRFPELTENSTIK
ncbi:MAG: adenylosuccinate lyase [Synergistaceae bacterium]|jgi:adenylosuccinate lyase|nr:adenylosuccinate lyase [Synergistaceae bacterium]MCK9436500.1 adenylosuccinate lyase [Synergistaceae bacterium]MDD2350102.1 adenylosuccinate lyase [Synergistaceae bacterium]MDD3319326.1 adenylosuccinate lyase [Synergistaceae bacterium]MDD3671970.1 adenylosuccinate lyase [Synergistaceae bacterium]